jgi:hypothetical protein
MEAIRALRGLASCLSFIISNGRRCATYIKSQQTHEPTWQNAWRHTAGSNHNRSHKYCVLYNEPVPGISCVSALASVGRPGWIRHAMKCGILILKGRVSGHPCGASDYPFEWRALHVRCLVQCLVCFSKMSIPSMVFAAVASNARAQCILHSCSACVETR